MRNSKWHLIALTALVVVAAIVGAQVAPLLSPEYESRAKTVKPDDAAGRFELGAWAFKQGLFQEAEIEADKLLALDKADQRGKYLKSAAEFYRTGKYGTVDVSAGTVVPPPPPRTGAVVFDLSDEEVDQLYRQLGDKRMTEFRELSKTWITPKCAAADCHGNPDKSRFYLKTQNPLDKRTLAENVKSIEQFVNKLDLGSSRILLVALAPADKHPGGAVFRTENDPGYRALKAWVTGLPGMWGP